MIEIDNKLGSKYESPWREETSDASVLIVAKSVLANRVIDLGIHDMECSDAIRWW